MFALLTLPILNFSQNLDPVTDLSILDWLAGTWEHKSAKTVTIEKWEKISDRTFDGINFVRKLNDQEPVFSESLRLLNMQGEVFYLAKVDHNEMPIPFKLVSMSKEIFVFENKNHDFPRKITYTFHSADSLTVNVQVM